MVMLLCLLSREMHRPPYPTAALTMPGYFLLPLVELGSHINKLSGSIFSHHGHFLNWVGAALLAGVAIVVLLFPLFWESVSTGCFIHFSVSHHNILLLALLTF